MSRSKSLSDADVAAHVISALNEGGEKTASFGQLAKRCGLAPATLAQRFGSVDGMIRAALLAEWARLNEMLDSIAAEALNSSKGAQGLLKQLPPVSPQVLLLSMRDEACRNAAAQWREKVEDAISLRRGGGSKGREAAALIFAAWQGRALWEQAGGKAFRLADLMKAMS